MRLKFDQNYLEMVPLSRTSAGHLRLRIIEMNMNWYPYQYFNKLGSQILLVPLSEKRHRLYTNERAGVSSQASFLASFSAGYVFDSVDFFYSEVVALVDVARDLLHGYFPFLPAGRFLTHLMLSYPVISRGSYLFSRGFLVFHEVCLFFRWDECRTP